MASPRIHASTPGEATQKQVLKSTTPQPHESAENRNSTGSHADCHRSTATTLFRSSPVYTITTTASTAPSAFATSAALSHAGPSVSTDSASATTRQAPNSVRANVPTDTKLPVG